MTRSLNFSAGPATLPLSVLKQVQSELLDHNGTGISILETSHRTKPYEDVHQEAKSLMKELLSIPDTHEVIFMHGGASAQFACVPMNLLPAGKSADYITTGTWSENAIKEAKVIGTVREAGTGLVGDKYTRVPSQSDLDLDSNAAYVHMTSNNTIMGTQFHTFPDTGNVPLICDMSSDIMSRPMDVSKFGLIYAGAQKNLGPSGITILIIRKDLAGEPANKIPKAFRYKVVLEKDSLQNTIATFPVYVVRGVLRWIKELGGLEAMQKRNEAKAKLIYDLVDGDPEFFSSPVETSSRSLMNPVFRLPSEELEKKMVSEASQKRILGIKGHRSVGGIRTSIYNAMERENVEAFVEFAKAFAKTNR